MRHRLTFVSIVAFLTAGLVAAHWATAAEAQSKPASTAAASTSKASTAPAETNPAAAVRPAWRPEKLRILIDKVVTRDDVGRLTDDMFRQIADAGFNVVSPRSGGDDEQQIRNIATMAARHGLDYTVWLRGTVVLKGVAKLTSVIGKESPAASPNSDGYWDWLTRNVLTAARVSKDCANVRGVFLDLEVYQSPVIWAFPISYDEPTLKAFAAQKNLTLPTVPPEGWAGWLNAQNLGKEFEAQQVAQWRDRCRQLRHKVDEINPDFVFIVYPGPYSRFVNEAAIPEWSTPRAPIILADVYTYGRPPWFGGPLKRHEAALEANAAILRKTGDYLKKLGVPFRYVGGIDPAVQGADPEFSGHNAVMMSELTDGYWVFYEGPSRDRPDHAKYWDWFTKANRAIAAGHFGLYKQPRQTPDIFSDVPKPATDKIQIGVWGLSKAAMDALESSRKYEVHVLGDVTADTLKPLAGVVLQDYSYSPWHAKKGAAALKAFADGGHSVLLLGDSQTLMGKPAAKLGETGDLAPALKKALATTKPGQ